MSITREINFLKLVHDKLREAGEMYNLVEEMKSVVVLTTLNSTKVLGHAGRTLQGVHYINFSRSLVIKQCSHLNTLTIPHEIAHVVCNMLPVHGNAHDDGWKAVCVALGGDGKEKADSRTVARMEGSAARQLRKVMAEDVLQGVTLADALQLVYKEKCIDFLVSVAHMKKRGAAIQCFVAQRVRVFGA